MQSNMPADETAVLPAVVPSVVPSVLPSVLPAIPALFFAPFVSSPMRVEAEWIDYNGHLNMAFYHVLFDRAVDELFGLVGLGPDYVRQHDASFFVAETHVRYLRELLQGDPVRVTVQLLDCDDKRMHYFMELRHAEEGWLSATTENLSLHVGMGTKTVTPFPTEIVTNLAMLKAAHAGLKKPGALGRVISIHNRNSASTSGKPPAWQPGRTAPSDVS